MKKKGKSNGTSKKQVSISNKVTETKEKESDFVDLDDEEIGFGAWLKSGEGIEWMRVFVIGNSIAVFLTMCWPHMKKSLSIIAEMIYGEDE
jgi:hypothetical protein